MGNRRFKRNLEFKENSDALYILYICDAYNASRYIHGMLISR